MLLILFESNGRFWARPRSVCAGSGNEAIVSSKSSCPTHEDEEKDGRQCARVGAWANDDSSTATGLNPKPLLV